MSSILQIPLDGIPPGNILRIPPGNIFQVLYDMEREEKEMDYGAKPKIRAGICGEIAKWRNGLCNNSTNTGLKGVPLDDQVVIFGIQIDNKGNVILKQGSSFEMLSLDVFDKFAKSGVVLMSMFLKGSRIIVIVYEKIPGSVMLIKMREQAQLKRKQDNETNTN